MELRTLFEKIAQEYPVAKQQELKNHPLTKFIRSQVPKSFEKICDVCSKTFQRNSDFENHMIDKHDVEKSFECDICRKTFLLKWRLKKHKQIHTGKTKSCHFFLNKTPCPFSSIGCKFAREIKANKDNIDDIEDECPLEQNECHLGNLNLSSRDDLWEHVEAKHVEYFQGMVEYAAENRTHSF